MTYKDFSQFGFDELLALADKVDAALETKKSFTAEDWETSDFSDLIRGYLMHKEEDKMLSSVVERRGECMRLRRYIAEILTDFIIKQPNSLEALDNIFQLSGKMQYKGRKASTSIRLNKRIIGGDFGDVFSRRIAFGDKYTDKILAMQEASRFKLNLWTASLSLEELFTDKRFIPSAYTKISKQRRDKIISNTQDNYRFLSPVSELFKQGKEKEIQKFMQYFYKSKEGLVIYHLWFKNAMNALCKTDMVETALKDFVVLNTLSKVNYQKNFTEQINDFVPNYLEQRRVLSLLQKQLSLFNVDVATKNAYIAAVAPFIYKLEEKCQIPLYKRFKSPVVPFVCTDKSRNY